MTLFFSTQRASFSNVISFPKVICICGSLHQLQDRLRFNALVARKLLHKPYLPSASELQCSVIKNAKLEYRGKLKEMKHESNRKRLDYERMHIEDGKEGRTPFVIVKVSEPAIMRDTLCQINAHGLYKVNTQVHITAAQMTHGLCVGVATSTTTPFQNHINVSVKAVNESIEEKPKQHNNSKKIDIVVEDVKTNMEKRNENKVHKLHQDTEEQYYEELLKLELTVRCPEEEPVVTGQVVWVVSEPGAGIYCLAIRPPRSFAGEFNLTMREIVDKEVCNHTDSATLHQVKSEDVCIGEMKANTSLYTKLSEEPDVQESYKRQRQHLLPKLKKSAKMKKMCKVF